MLRESAEHQALEPSLIPITAGCGETGLGPTDHLLALTDAVVLRDSEEYPDARVRAELTFGRDGTDRIAMVAANFCMMNVLMDAVGGPVPANAPEAETLSVTIPDHLIAPA